MKTPAEQKETKWAAARFTPGRNADQKIPRVFPEIRCFLWGLQNRKILNKKLHFYAAFLFSAFHLSKTRQVVNKCGFSSLN